MVKLGSTMGYSLVRQCGKAWFDNGLQLGSTMGYSLVRQCGKAWFDNVLQLGSTMCYSLVRTRFADIQHVCSDMYPTVRPGLNK